MAATGKTTGVKPYHIAYPAGCKQWDFIPAGTAYHFRQPGATANYMTDKKIQSGGYGTVYRVVDTKNRQQPVVVKDIDMEAAGRHCADPDVFSDELNGLHMAGQLVACGQHKQHFFIIMRSAGQQDLVEFINSAAIHTVSLRDYLNAALLVIGAVERIHRDTPLTGPQLLHLDLKPDNLMVRVKDGKIASVMAVDFGLSKRMPREARRYADFTLPKARGTRGYITLPSSTKIHEADLKAGTYQYLLFCRRLGINFDRCFEADHKSAAYHVSQATDCFALGNTLNMMRWLMPHDKSHFTNPLLAIMASAADPNLRLPLHWISEILRNFLSVTEPSLPDHILYARLKQIFKPLVPAAIAFRAAYHEWLKTQPSHPEDAVISAAVDSRERQLHQTLIRMYHQFTPRVLAAAPVEAAVASSSSSMAAAASGSETSTASQTPEHSHGSGHSTPKIGSKRARGEGNEQAMSTGKPISSASIENPAAKKARNATIIAAALAQAAADITASSGAPGATVLNESEAPFT